ncbi:isopentenyl-diphosphate Delta-isomerase [Idiomarina xiamenensis]|uniref:Isopentenyl-diphosphate Delta-isomerase n=1 Tax=Idiomarina xiamenensis 10-D-4 TaxID=740709 RepID=K2K6Y2_9GAMM|nr:isopentenyl-diphosphate Delta-isomerase [Idiomarina xiamenensis]EKE83433.1 isopentenyl-diphosphate delta-isomerase [Idiomarina xiamenensis 10-D-4]
MLKSNEDTNRNNVVLVDNSGNFIGIKDKLQAHIDGDLHSAFSVFVFNKKSELLLQRRASNKYHSGGLWSNTCCSHPFPNENTTAAGKRRLQEEMGFQCEIAEIHTKIYNVPCSNGLIENEYNKVFIGRFDGTPEINDEEVEDWRWISVNQLLKDMKTSRDEYTSWFPVLLEDVIAAWNNA